MVVDHRRVNVSMGTVSIELTMDTHLHGRWRQWPPAIHGGDPPRPPSSSDAHIGSPSSRAGTPVMRITRSKVASLSANIRSTEREDGWNAVVIIPVTPRDSFQDTHDETNNRSCRRCLACKRTRGWAPSFRRYTKHHGIARALDIATCQTPPAMNASEQASALDIEPELY